ncbi:MAG: hypothetical protein L0Y56_02720 [Nitrospira sp.]|nr:hypothetical protein [Nitrospira sp.]
MADYTRQYLPFSFRGVSLVRPTDRLQTQDGTWISIAKNLRQWRLGEIRQRPALHRVGPTAGIDASPAGTAIFRLNDLTSAKGFARFIANETGNIKVDDSATHSIFTTVSSGYSNKPPFGVTARPDLSPRPFLYLANDAKQEKFDVDGNPRPWGLPAPSTPPTAELGRLAYKVIDDCEATAGFSASAGTLTAPARFSAIAVTVIIYDSGSTGFCSVVPEIMDEQWQEGLRLDFSLGPERVIIESVYQGVSPTTIGSISYDSGSTGLCTIQPATPTQGLERNAVVRLNAVEQVRVLSVTEGLDGIPSFRCSTVGTFSAGQTLDGFRSFRTFTVNTHTNAETLSANAVQLALTGAGSFTLTKAGALDLSKTDIAFTRPTQADDYVHLSLNVSNFALITEIQLQFDIDRLTNDFTQNYFFKAIRPPDLQAAISQSATSLTAQQQEIQRQQLDEFRRQELEAERERLLQMSFDRPLGVDFGDYAVNQQRIAEITNELGSGLVFPPGQGAVSDPGTPGVNQWSELFIPLKEFVKVGSDETRNWSNVASFRITIVTTATVTIQIDSLWIGGTFGLDYTGGRPNGAGLDTRGAPGYIYVFRFRSSVTGEKSNPSPPTRSPVFPVREPVVLSGAAIPNAFGNIIDVFRIGGTLAEYHYVGSIGPDPGFPYSFTDSISDEVATRNPTLDFDLFQPWPLPDLPRSGQCNVVGTTVIQTSGDTFNTAWARGTPIVIDGLETTLYAPPTSTTRLELSDSLGTRTAVKWQIPEPLLVGQPLPVAFGPYTGGSGGNFIMALGDPKNPGYLYYTNGDSPDAASDRNILEVTDPSESLISGGILDGVAYAFTDRRSYRILPSFSGGASGAGSDFYTQETAMGKGLASRWALTFGDQIYFVSYDGIYASRGDAVVSLTDDSLFPLFRHDGVFYPQTSFLPDQVAPISFAAADARFIRLEYSKDGLYFTYKGLTDGKIYEWYYSFLSQGWWRDTHPVNIEIRTHYREDGPSVDSVLSISNFGVLYNFDSILTIDDGTSFFCQLDTPEENWGDQRAFKDFRDFIVDIAVGSNIVSGSLKFDDNAFSIPIANITDVTLQRKRVTQDVVAGVGVSSGIRAVALSLFWNSSGSTSSPLLYGWEPAAIPKPEPVLRRATDWDSAGYDGPKWVQGFRITADTFAVDKTFRVEFDEGVTAETFTINHSGETTTDISFAVPFVAHNLRIVGNDDDLWKIMRIEWVAEPEPPLVSVYHTQVTTLDLPGYFHIRDFLIAYSNTAAATFQILVDGVSESFSLTSSGGARVKTYFVPLARKGKTIQFILNGGTAGIRAYLKDLEIRAKPWGDPGPYQIFRPFGDLTRTNGGARI